MSSAVQFLAQAVQFARPGEIDHLHEAELPAAIGAVGEPDPAGLGEHLEPRAGRVRPDGEHVPEHGPPVRQVPLLVPAVEQDLPPQGGSGGMGPLEASTDHAPTPRLRGIEYSSSCRR